MAEKKYPGEIVGYVFRTTDYNALKKLKGNRDIFEPRKKKIISSIRENGWIRNPVVVNEKMEVIDGQGRTEALEELGMPVEYVVSVGATIDHCIALNLKQKNWGIFDFIKSYAAQGDEAMQMLERLILKYGDITISAILEVCTVGGRRQPTDLVNGIKSKTIKVYDEFTCDEILQFVRECLRLIGRGKGRADTWAASLKLICLSDDLDEKKFLKQLEKQSGSVQGVTTEKDALRQAEKIYNYGTSNKVYFASIAAQYKREGK